jgi:hypothetical protein
MAIIHDAPAPREAIEFLYRKTFGLTQEQLDNERIDVFNLNSKIMDLIKKFKIVFVFDCIIILGTYIWGFIDGIFSYPEALIAFFVILTVFIYGPMLAVSFIIQAMINMRNRLPWFDSFLIIFIISVLVYILTFLIFFFIEFILGIFGLFVI